nr:flagellar basal body L-ring protein FlgH [Cytophagales bacterium]
MKKLDLIKPLHFVFRLATVAVVLELQSLQAQSLWKNDFSRSQFADITANRVGDIINIIIQEQNSNSQKANTQTAKNSSIDASIQNFLYAPGVSGLLTKGGQLPRVSMSGGNEYSGGGQITNSKQMTARIAVMIVDILPGGQLLIEGRKSTEISQEKQEIILQGVIRQADITGGNTVFSYNVANATIQIISKGALSQPQRKGWLTKTWDKISPF